MTLLTLLADAEAATTLAQCQPLSVAQMALTLQLVGSTLTIVQALLREDWPAGRPLEVGHHGLEMLAAIQGHLITLGIVPG